MIHTHTMSQLKTVQEPMKLLSSTNKTNIAIGNLSNETVTTTAPANSGSATIIPASSLNYIKIVPLFTAFYGSQAIRVVGFTKSDVGDFYIPHLLFYGVVSSVNTSATAFVNSATNLYPALSITKQEGDAKVYSTSTTSRAPASLLIDTLGCQLIEVEFAAGSAGGTCNAFYGAI
jgi:hypothetical protein